MIKRYEEKYKSIPVNKISDRSGSGIFFKHTSDWKRDGALDFPHRDDYYILIILLDGEAKAEVDLNDVTIRGGEGFVIVPGQVHFPKLGERYPLAWSLFVSPDNINEACCQLFEQYSLNPSPLKFSSVTLNDISRLFEMLRRYSDNIEFSRAMVSAIVNLCCLAVIPSEKPYCDRYVVLTLQFKNLLHKKIAEEKRPGAYASMLNISGVYLNEVVKAVTGISVSAFIRAQVVLNAKRLLLHTSQSVCEIADALGYDDYSYFSRLFKKETGITPSDFRKNLD